MVTTFALVKQFFYWDKFFVLPINAHFLVVFIQILKTWKLFLF